MNGELGRGGIFGYIPQCSSKLIKMAAVLLPVSERQPFPPTAYRNYVVFDVFRRSVVAGDIGSVAIWVAVVLLVTYYNAH